MMESLGRILLWRVRDNWNREDFRAENLRQWGQGGLQDGEFETTGTGRTSRWGV